MDSLSEADQSWNDNADCTCNRGGAQEENHRVAGDLTCRFCISDAADAHDNWAEYHRENHHIQGVHVDAADDAGYGQNRRKAVRQKKSG